MNTQEHTETHMHSDTHAHIHVSVHTLAHIHKYQKNILEELKFIVDMQMYS